MKKGALIFMLSLSFGALTAFATACEQSSSASESAENEYTVTFVNGSGYSYVKENTAASFTIKTGETVDFSLKIGAYYTGEPIVTVNDIPLSAIDGVYTLEATEDLTVAVSGIEKAVSNMSGSGTVEDKFIVTRPIDLAYIAEQVNAGNELYSKASYALGNDIDLKGEALSVIGNGRGESAFFSGSFSGYGVAENGETVRYGISNFKIDSKNLNHTGLFGSVRFDPTVAQSALFNGVLLNDFTLKASTANLTKDTQLYCGALIGYAVGATIYDCDAFGGEVVVFSDETHTAYAGGLVGCQEGYHAPQEDYFQSAEIAYSGASVNVAVLQGVAYYAGGLVGYAFTDNPTAPALIHNAYTTGSVNGALRSGGIVGGLGGHATVSGCYATGDVSALCKQRLSAVNDSNDSYCYAYAGGLVGYAENDSVVTDSFSAGEIVAKAVEGDAFTFADKEVGGRAEDATLTIDSKKSVSYHNATGVTAETANAAATALGWKESDWVFTENEYPLPQRNAPRESFPTTISINYISNDGKPVAVNAKTTDSFTYSHGYEPFSRIFEVDGWIHYPTADDGRLAYGYFFDAACKNPVPYSYLVTHDLTLFIGFADPKPILGSYAIQTRDGEAELRVLASGVAEYERHGITQSFQYRYDGATFLLLNANISYAYSSDEAFDFNRYEYFNYRADYKGNGKLELYENAYFTKSKPLTAYKITNAHPKINDFEGVWYGAGNGGKVYSFDDQGNYELQLASETTFGTYQVTDNGEIATLSNGEILRFDDDGFLRVQDGNGNLSERLSSHPNTGLWRTADGSFAIHFFDGNRHGVGRTVVSYANGVEMELLYEQSETDGVVCLYLVTGTGTTLYKLPYGYYSLQNGVAKITLRKPLVLFEEFESFECKPVDAFEGEWISENETIPVIYFNGNGQLKIGETTVSYTVTHTPYGAPLYGGSFSIDTVTYTFNLDETQGVVRVSDGQTEIVFERKSSSESTDSQTE